MLKLDSISKSFGGLPALREVSLAAQPGSVHGLLGENGAGKSTLMNILFGLVKPDAGSIMLGGRPLMAGSPAAAARAGIGMVHQHFKLVGTLSVLENFALAVGRGVGMIPRRALRRRLEQLAQTLGTTLEPDRIVATLSVGEQQRLEIIKALAAGSDRSSGGGTSGRVLILDEPTAVLTPQEFVELARAIRNISEAGTAVIFISHKLAEVRAVCDELTILRRGKVVHAGPAAELSPGEIAEKMVGGPVAPLGSDPRAPMPADGRAILEVTGVTVTRGRQSPLRDATLSVRAGEIVGVAGVDGNGQSELVSAIIGTEKLAGGTLRIDGRDAAAMPLRWRIDTLAYIPEDRHRQALVLPLSVRDNLMLKTYRSLHYSLLGLIRRDRWTTHAEGLARQFDIRAGSVEDPVSSLSGGNQQKLVIAREMENNRRIVVAVNPTRGLDVGATAFVMRQLIAARNGGAAVLLVHSDLDELIAVSDRILVLFAGTLRESPAGAAKETIGRMMLGLAAAPAERCRMIRALLQSLLSLAFAAAAAVVALLAVVLMLYLLDDPPLYVLHQWLLGACGESTDFFRSLREAAPLLMTGLAAGIAFRCGVLNIGGEGQYLCGAIASVAVAHGMPAAAPLLVIPAAIASAAAAGAAWALIAALLERFRGVPLVLSTILLNSVALYLVKILVTGALQEPGQGEQSFPIPPAHFLPILQRASGLHAGVILAAVAALAAWVIQSRTLFGFEILVTGHNPEAARLSGIPVQTRALQVMALSGALAGVGGAIQTLGVNHNVLGDSPGYGYAGIAVALLGRLHPLGILAAAVFFGMLQRGATSAESDPDYPLSHYAADLVKGLILIVLLSANFWTSRWRLGPKTPPAPVEAPLAP